MAAVVDLRSDTLTRPTPAMRQAMAQAEVGDDVYGEDPTVNALEARVAALTGHQAGLFVATGSLGNQLGLRLACPPGAELLCDSGAHVVTYELGAAAAVSGITTRTFDSAGGVPDPRVIAAMVRPEGYGTVPTAALSLEQTHNRAGGTVLPLEVVRAVSVLAREHGLALHIDGARLWNACAAAGFAPSEVGELATTMSVCLSKGLGAPVGSVLVGSIDAMTRARVWRKRLGGGMRQAGILAAAGLHALDHHVDRLTGDHARAQLLAKTLELPAPATNIVVLPVVDAAAAVAAAAEGGVRVGALDAHTLRAVTHLDVDDDGIEIAAKVLRPLLSPR